MESCKSIIEATATRWRWMTKCWRLRLPVREALLAPKADTTESVMTKAELEFWKNKANETDKALKESKDANKALVHFIHTRNTPDVDLRAVKKAMATVALAFLPLLAMSQPLEPYRHNFFTTNPAPVVDVLPGTNVSVQFTTTGTSQRHYTVNSDTNVTVKVATSAVNATNFWGTLSPTNLPIGLSTSNYVGVFSGDGTGLTNLYVGLTAGRIPVTDTGGILVTVPTLLYDDVLNQMIINENAVAGASSLVGTALSVRGADNAQIRIGVSSFGIAGAGAFAIRHARGTAAIPTAASTGDQIMSLEGWGYGTTGYGVAPSATVRGNAADLWTDTSMPSYITFRTTPTNSLLPAEQVRINPNGFVGIGTNNPIARVDIKTGADATIGQIIRANSATQTGDLQQFVDGSGTVIAKQQYVAGANSARLLFPSGGDTFARFAVLDPTFSNFYFYFDGLGSLQWGNGSAPVGKVKLSRTANDGLLLQKASSPDLTGVLLGVKGVASQTGDLQQWRDVNDNVLANVTIAGNVGIGTNAPQAKLHVELDALGTTIVPGLLLSNATAAALGAQQNSPALMLGGQGWRTSTSGSTNVAMGFNMLPTQGTSADPLGTIQVVRAIGGNAPIGTGTSFSSSGTANIGGTLIANGALFAAPASGIAWNGVSPAMTAPKDGMIAMNQSTAPGFTNLLFGGGTTTARLNETTNWPALRMENNTNNVTLGVRKGTNAMEFANLVADRLTSSNYFTGNTVTLTNGEVIASGSVTATNNYIHQIYATNGFTYCNSTNEYYLVNAYTNPLFVLPDASTVKGQKFEFTTTNQSCFFIVTNWTGTQTIANGSYLSYTNNNNGQKVVAFISDGAHWWLATKGRTILPSACWSCNTNITFPSVTNMVTLDTQEANNGVGITLDNSAWTTAGVGSRIWVTNAGMYLLTFSAMWSKTGGGSANGDVWIRQNGTMIPRTMTLQTIQNSTSTNVMTVNFILPVTQTTYFDLVGASPDGTAQMQAMPAITSPFARPAAPSIIVTLQKTSD